MPVKKLVSLAVPSANSTANNDVRDVVGNKTDTAVAVVGTTASIQAYLKGILTTVLGIGNAQTETAVYGPQTVDVDNTGHFEITLVDKDVGLVVSTAITAGTYQLVRMRAGSSTNIGAVSAWSKANGRVYVDITFATANWDTDDTFKIVPQGDTTYAVGGSTFYPPLPTISGFIADLSTIEGKIDAIAADIGDASASTLGSLLLILGNPASSISSVLGTNLVLAVGAGSAAADQPVNAMVRWGIDNLALASLNNATTAGRTQIVTKAVAVDYAAGSTAILTVSNQACLLKRLSLYAVAGATADLTSIVVTDSTAQVTLIDAALGARANLDTARKQVGWQGPIYLPVGETINVDPTGTTGTNTNFLMVAEYEAIVSGGTLG